MPQFNLNAVLALLVYAAVTGVLNLLLSERSRVDAWAESKPRLAAALKLLRAVGFDPWNLVAAVTLTFTKKLPQPAPVKPPTLPVLMLLVPAVFFSMLTWVGCSSSDRARDIKTSIDAARAACLVYDASKAQLPKPVVEADEFCPLLMAHAAVPEPASTASGGAGI